MDYINQINTFYDTKQIVKDCKLNKIIYESCNYDIMIYFLDAIKENNCHTNVLWYENIKKAFVNNNVNHLILMNTHFGKYSNVKLAYFMSMPEDIVI